MNKIPVLLWFLHIYKPEWLISYYIPALKFLRPVPRLLLYFYAIIFFVSVTKKKHDGPFLIFIFSVLCSTLFAYNFGISRSILEQYIDSYLLLIILLGNINKKNDLIFYFKIYLIAYIYYFIFGIFHNGLVPFHPILADEDAFGPYMVMGVVALYFSAFTCGKIFKKNIAGSLLCVAGVVLSFARGAVIGLTAGLIFIIFKSKKKIITLITVVIMILVASSASLYFFENSQYFEELKTITKASAETESDRIFYWTKAFLIFKDNPIFGAGPRNYGFILPEYVTRDESLERGFYTGFWYGRVPHSLYLQLISEQGIFGALSMIVLLMVFWKRTSSTPRKQTNMPSLEYKSLYHYSLAIKGIMLVFLTTGLFYDFLYSHWLFEFYFLGTAIHNISVFEHELISHEQEFH